jgi:osomolarity two-component system sensor histidine kinase NIK1
MTASVNSMASRVTSHVGIITRVTTAVAQSGLSEKIHVDACGEILELKTTIGATVDQLALFVVEVSKVAREVGSADSSPPA